MIQVTPLPILRDNYVWALHDDERTILVDPGEAPPILAWLAARHMAVSAYLITHHHADHVGGLAGLLARHPAPVYGPTRGAVPAMPLKDGEILDIPGTAWRFQVLATPGHTLDHICYVGHGHLFCGDTLFSCGCGRLFEGSPAQMQASLTRIAALPPETRVCCAHEYTLANIAFATEVEPDNAALQTRQVEALALRKAGLPTLPVPLASELACNPFLRCDQDTVLGAASKHVGAPVARGVEAFAAVRAWKDEAS